MTIAATGVAHWRRPQTPRHDPLAGPAAATATAAENVAEEALAENVAKGLENIAHVAEVRGVVALQALEAV
ncbi:MAG: hypothetical protein ACLPNY_19640, partial [Roseiarcus sp.]